ncbi:MAG: hypothetical protein HC905_19690 [Bacteroidales bacterium]|nr:hypothetical protein [Bacteroidales bacterium]
MNDKRKEPNAKAKVCQPIPATIPSLPNTCFLPTAPAFVDNFLQLDKFLNADFFTLAE